MKNFIARTVWMTIMLTGVTSLAIPDERAYHFLGLGLLGIGLGVAAEILFKEDK